MAYYDRLDGDSKVSRSHTNGRAAIRPSLTIPGRDRSTVKDGIRSYVTPMSVSGIVSLEQTEQEKLREILSTRDINSIKNDLAEIKTVYAFACASEKYELISGLMDDISRFRQFFYLCGRYHRDVKPEMKAALPGIRDSFSGLERKIKRTLRQISSK